MSLPKIGEVIDHVSGKWIVTGRFPEGVRRGFVLLTQVPNGCTEQDLGTKFGAADIHYANQEPNERLWEWPDETKGRKA
jgi:hypothetical protein